MGDDTRFPHGRAHERPGGHLDGTFPAHSQFSIIEFKRTMPWLAPASLDAMEARIKAIEEGLKPKATQLKEAVETKVEKLRDKSPTTRRNFMEIFNATVPDSVEVGVVAE